MNTGKRSGRGGKQGEVKEYKSNSALSAVETIGICSNIKAASAAMKLDNNHVIACEHVRAEEDGDVTYEKGVKLADQLQIQMGHVHDYIAQISETLEKADECVASGSRLEAPAGRSDQLLKRGN